MSRNRFDQASRYAAKMDAAGFVAWLLGVPSPPLPFAGWLDTRTLPFPGDPERTCDTVACLDDRFGAAPWAIPIEFCLTPDGSLFGRLLVYLGELWLERRPGLGEGRRYRVAAAVVNLTGQGTTSHDMRLPPTTLRTCLDVVERNLAREDGAAVLEQIAVGEVRRCLLPWIPLMRGGDDPAILDRWKELAGAEADSARRADYGGLAIVFAEAADRQFLWKLALKEWNMVESQQVLEWMAEGAAKARTEEKAQAILRLLQKKFPPEAPADVKATIQAATDLNQLDRWFDAAIDAHSIDDFRRAVTS